MAVNTLPRLDDCPYVFCNSRRKDRWSDFKKSWEEVARWDRSRSHSEQVL